MDKDVINIHMETVAKKAQEFNRALKDAAADGIIINVNTIKNIECLSLRKPDYIEVEMSIKLPTNVG